MSEFEAANPEDLKQIINLLSKNNLPVKDISFDNQQFWKYQQNRAILAIAGIEKYGKYAIFRSFVAHENIRGTGIAYKLYSHCLKEAKNLGIKKLFLLTTSAKDWFTKQNWSIINRKNVPVEISDAEEFKSICPASATCMSIVL